MSHLSEKRCTPCEGDESPLSHIQAQNLQKQLTQNWQVVANKKIRYQFKLDSFASAIEFVNKIAKVAEEEDHHPDIIINYKKVTIELTTHAIGGLSENDFIMAAKIENAL
ncbi:MAG: 4a-hydroxytetrahydrobiopterin dehydratase [Candidatus Andersenbacteria bacterium]|nr:4a-hydroxytetrahydrobiopterin dehydratase [Candidatus Andersenbacteria bacterium]